MMTISTEDDNQISDDDNSTEDDNQKYRWY